jgi:hypothetical protein
MDEWTTNQFGSYGQYTPVFAALGTNSIPFVLRRLSRDDSFLKNSYREVYPKLPGFIKKYLPARNPRSGERFFQASMAAAALQACGSNAVPVLIPKLKDGNPAVREACFSSVSGLAHSSMSTRETISTFLPCLDDSEPMVRVNAALFYGRLGPAASNAIPALIRNLRSNETGRHHYASERVYVRAISAMALGQIGPPAVSAVPALTNLMASTNSYARASAACAVWQITSNASLSLPVLIGAFPTYDRDAKWQLIQTFAEMGPLAKSALPLLTNELKNADRRTWEMLTNALKRIDSEAAEKAGVTSEPKEMR